MLSTFSVIYNLVAHAGFGYETFGHDNVMTKSLFIFIFRVEEDI